MQLWSNQQQSLQDLNIWCFQVSIWISYVSLQAYNLIGIFILYVVYLSTSTYISDILHFQPIPVYVAGTCSASGALFVIVLAILVAMVIILKYKRRRPTPNEPDKGTV